MFIPIRRIVYKCCNLRTTHFAIVGIQFTFLFVRHSCLIPSTRTVSEFLVHGRNSANLERQEEPGKWEIVWEIQKKPEKEVDDLDPTEDGEAGEKTHGASNQTQLGFYCHLQINSN